MAYSLMIAESTVKSRRRLRRFDFLFSLSITCTTAERDIQNWSQSDSRRDGGFTCRHDISMRARRYVRAGALSSARYNIGAPTASIQGASLDYATSSGRYICTGSFSLSNAGRARKLSPPNFFITAHH